MAENGNVILNELKVHPRNCASSSKLNVVYNGISASSWLMPIGIEQRRPIRGTTSRGMELHDEIKKQLIVRAKSASVVLGKRYADCIRQNIKSDELIVGVNILRKVPHSAVVSNTPIGPFDRSAGDESVWSYVGVNTSFAAKEMCKAFRELTIEGSPIAFRWKKTNRLHFRQEPTRDVRENMFQLNMEKLIHDPQSINDSHEMFNSLGSTHISDGKTSATQPSRRSRYKKSPLQYPSNSIVPGYCDTKQKLARARSYVINEASSPKQRHLPLFWRTSSHYHRMQRSANECLLRPLLYDNELSENMPRGSGCKAYKCKGCFHAYLVSDDYLEQLEKHRYMNIERLKTPSTKQTDNYGSQIMKERWQPAFSRFYGESFKVFGE